MLEFRMFQHYLSPVIHWSKIINFKPVNYDHEKKAMGFVKEG